jgi:hypothetical protein
VSDLRPISETIGRVGRVPGVDPTVSRARGVWAQAVGPQVAANSSPVRMTGGALLVHCSSSTWAGELALLSAQVAARLGELMGAEAPAELRFQVGRIDDPAEPAEPAPPPPPPATPDQVAEADRLSAAVPDERLRARVREALLLSRRRGL